jgi:hypothetical protein
MVPVYSGIEDVKRDAGRNVSAFRRIWVSAGGGRRMVSVYYAIEEIKRDALPRRPADTPNTPTRFCYRVPAIPK